MTRTAWIASLSAFGIVIAGAASCVVDSYTPSGEAGGAGGTGSQTVTSVTTGTGMGGSGGMGGDQASASTSGPSGPGPGPSSSSASGSASSGGAQCVSSKDCLTANPCETPICSPEGVCANQKIDNQAIDYKPSALGDCAKYVCKDGVLTKEEDPSDVPNDGNLCSSDICVGGQPQHNLSPIQQCALPEDAGLGFCAALEMNTVFTCVECTSDTTCLTGLCRLGRCVPKTCGDGLQGGSETDVNCGGAECPPCAQQQGCIVNTDCFSKKCANGKCAAPTCSDGIKNGKETGPDCGNPAETGCPTCPAGKTCLANSDCATGICYGSICNEERCDDNVQNGIEQDVDCGGNCPLPCK